MLTACGRVHRTSLADLREALQPRLALPDRNAKGAAKGGDRAKGRNGGTTNTEQEEVKTRKRKGRDGAKGGGKSKRKGKGNRSDSVERPTKKKKVEDTAPTQAPDAKGKGK